MSKSPSTKSGKNSIGITPQPLTASLDAIPVIISFVTLVITSLIIITLLTGIVLLATPEGYQTPPFLGTFTNFLEGLLVPFIFTNLITTIVLHFATAYFPSKSRQVTIVQTLIISTLIALLLGLFFIASSAGAAFNIQQFLTKQIWVLITTGVLSTLSLWLVHAAFKPTASPKKKTAVPPKAAVTPVKATQPATKPAQPATVTPKPQAVTPQTTTAQAVATQKTATAPQAVTPQKTTTPQTVAPQTVTAPQPTNTPKAEAIQPAKPPAQQAMTTEPIPPKESTPNASTKSTTQAPKPNLAAVGNWFMQPLGFVAQTFHQPNFVPVLKTFFAQAITGIIFLVLMAGIADMQSEYPIFSIMLESMLKEPLVALLLANAITTALLHFGVNYAPLKDIVKTNVPTVLHGIIIAVSTTIVMGFLFTLISGVPMSDFFSKQIFVLALMGVAFAAVTWLAHKLIKDPNGTVVQNSTPTSAQPAPTSTQPHSTTASTSSQTASSTATHFTQSAAIPASSQTSGGNWFLQPLGFVAQTFHQPNFVPVLKTFFAQAITSLIFLLIIAGVLYSYAPKAFYTPSFMDILQPLLMLPLLVLVLVNAITTALLHFGVNYAPLKDIVKTNVPTVLHGIIIAVSTTIVMGFLFTLISGAPMSDFFSKQIFVLALMGVAFAAVTWLVHKLIKDPNGTVVQNSAPANAQPAPASTQPHSTTASTSSQTASSTATHFTQSAAIPASSQTSGGNWFLQPLGFVAQTFHQPNFVPVLKTFFAQVITSLIFLLIIAGVLYSYAPKAFYTPSFMDILQPLLMLPLLVLVLVNAITTALLHFGVNYAPLKDIVKTNVPTVLHGIIIAVSTTIVMGFLFTLISGAPMSDFFSKQIFVLALMGVAFAAVTWLAHKLIK